MDEDRIEETEVLLRRFDLLDRLCRSPAHLRDLVEATDQSRSTINRAINELEEIGLIDRGNGGIEATLSGRLTRDRLEAFLSGYDDVRAAETVLDPLEPDTSIAAKMVDGCEVVPATDPAPYRPLERIHGDLARAEAYRALVPTLDDPRHVRLLYEHVVIDDNPAELVVTPSVFQTLQEEFPRRMTAMAETGRFGVFVGDQPSFGLGVLEYGPGSAASTAAAYLVVLSEAGTIHGLLVNDDEPAVRWAERRYAEYRNRADDRTDELVGNPDGGSVAIDSDGGSAVLGRSLPVALEREGFVRIDRTYFREEPVADPATAWRAGLSIAEVHTGYGIDRQASESEADSSRTFSGALEAELADGTDCVVLGPPGSGKSTVCKRVACQWYEADRGPVLYREGGRGRSFESVEALLAAVESLLTTPEAAEERVLVVVEDAVRPDADAIFEAIDRLGDRDDVAVLLDAREGEWNDRDREGEWTDGDPPPIDTADLEVRYLPRMTESDCKRLVERFEATTGGPVDVDAEQLWSAIREETAAEGESDGSRAGVNELLRLVHRLATYADPLADEPTALEEATASVYETTAGDDLVLSVSVLANALNAAGIGLDRELLYAVADPAEFDDVDGAIDRLEERMLFPGPDGSYRTVHESWSTAFLTHLLEVEGETAAADWFGTVVNDLLSLADEPDRRDRIAEHLGDRRAFATVVDDSGSWAEELLESIYAIGQHRSQLAPLFGDGEVHSVDLPAICSGSVVDDLQLQYARNFLAGGYYDRAERAFEQLPEEPADFEIERLLGLARIAFKRGDYEAAIDSCRECLSVLDDRADLDDRTLLEARTRAELGWALVESNEHDRAEPEYDRALEVFRAESHSHLEARTLLKLGELEHERNDFDRARDLYEEALDLLRSLGDRRGEADALADLGATAWQCGENERARQLFERALERRRALGDRHGEAKLLYNLGLLATRRGDNDRARSLLERSLETLRTVGDKRFEANALQTLGVIAKRERSGDARQLYERSLELYRELGAIRSEVPLLLNVGDLHKEDGDYDRASRSIERALELAAELDDDRLRAKSTYTLANLLGEQGELSRARELGERAHELAITVGDPAIEARAARSVGRLAMWQGQLDRAEQFLERSHHHYVDVEDPKGRALSANDLGTLAMHRGEHDRAAEWFETAVANASDADNPVELARNRCCLAEVATDRGDLEEAEVRLEAARAAIEGIDHVVELRVQFAAGRVALARGDLAAARSYAEAALEGYEDAGVPRWIGRLRLLQGRIAAADDEAETARERLLEALETFESIDAPHEALEVLRTLVVEAPGEDAERDRWRDRADDLLSGLPADLARQHDGWLE